LVYDGSQGTNFERVIDTKFKAKGEELITLELRSGLTPSYERGVFISKFSTSTGERLGSKQVYTFKTDLATTYSAFANNTEIG
tara:strand:- start:864 stop:1112 length:249 start_codon:yes stop_codon:yes gene_type:complete